MDLVKIGKLLQKLRKEKGFTQEQLAEQMGVARRTVSRWETGSNMPDLDERDVKRMTIKFGSQVQEFVRKQ